MSQQLLPFRPARPNKLIEAGAGTGKTTEIVKEVVELLLEHPDLRPERLVMITFTEKAAAEIGERIRDAMTDLFNGFAAGTPRWPSDSATPIIEIPAARLSRCRAACERHLQNLDKIRSQTIHAFCQSILRMFPLEARVDPNFGVIEGYERWRLLQESYAAWLEHETVGKPTEEWLDDWEKVLEHFTGVDRVQQAVFELLEKRVLVTDDRYSLGGFGDAEASIQEVIQATRQQTRRDLEAIADPGSGEVLRHLYDVPAPQSDSPDEWRAYFTPIEAALKNINLSRVPVPLREGLRRLRGNDKDPSVLDLLERHEVAIALRGLACRYIEFLDAEKQRRGVLDFDDLLVRTAELLRDDEAAEAVGAKFDYIFVDEFQDTDRVQAKIVERLARGRSGELVHGRVVLVGDPKQSIYAFRHADPETYRDTLARFEAGGAEKKTLSRQYRSAPELVESLNAMFPALFASEPDPDIYRPTYHELKPARPAAGGGPHLLFLRAEVTGDDDEVSAAAQEGRAIASYVRGEVAAGRKYRDFAVLLRKMANVQAFLDALDRYDIPYVLPPTGALLETRPVVELLAVLRSIAAPYDRGACVSAARSTWFALDDDEIVAGMLGAESPAWSEFNERMHAYRELSRRMSVSELIDRLAIDCEIELIYGVARGGAEWLRFLERFREMAVRFDLATGGSAGQFVDELLRRRETDEESQPTPIDDGRDAVRIMTVHGSKGLEFPVVILPELSAKTREDTLSVFAIEDPPRLVFSGEVTTLACRFLKLANNKTPDDVRSGRKSAEKDRLFYVAVTRAREKVVFVTSPDRRRQEFLKRVAKIFELESGWSPWDGQPGMVVGSLTARARSVPAGFVTPEPWREEAQASRFIDPRFEELAAAAPPEPAPRPAPEAPPTGAELIIRAAGSKNRAAGILLHRVLEVWDGEAALEPLLKELGREQAADPRAVELTRRRLETIARSPSFRRIVQGRTHGRELTVYYTDADGSAVEARIDRLLEEDGRLLVVDFKSGEPHRSRLEADREQVQRYCGAIARLTARDCSGLLWYIDADSDEVVAV